MDDLSQKDYLERTPPGTAVVVTDLESTDHKGSIRVRLPEIELHCPVCAGPRFFATTEQAAFIGNRAAFDSFLNYICRNCRRSFKTYAISASYDEESKKWASYKYGEDPAFGPPTPSRAITLIGPDRDDFLKGRRSENQGLGIGAFAYYRRVVENQKARIFDEVIRVSKHLGAAAELLDALEKAKAETQFTKAVESIKQALPQSLLVNGQNPLTLLHSALSAGVHELTDEQCLALASSIRIVLIEFAERMALAMKNEKELNEAVSRLTKPQG